MIGHGTSGEVRRAINRTTGKQVAVKVIETRKFALTPGLTPKELVQEAEMLKRVDHEYIIRLEDIFQARQGAQIRGRLGREAERRDRPEGEGGRFWREKNTSVYRYVEGRRNGCIVGAGRKREGENGGERRLFLLA